MQTHMVKNIEMIEGLLQSPKSIPSKYFYDERGDALFVKIMNVPEYYLTNCEEAIFNVHAKHLFEDFELSKDDYFEIIELGAGDGIKTKILLEFLIHAGYQFTYKPIDISKNALETLEANLSDLEGLMIEGLAGDYFEKLELLKQSAVKKIVLFLGSNLGNMDDETAQNFLASLSANLNFGDGLLLGLDLKKDASIILPAYNDTEGVTRDFNLNLLRRMNREFSADFDLDKFRHAPEYNPEGKAMSYLESLEDQTVHFSSISQSIHFERGEKILTEISRKYDDELLRQLLSASMLEIKNKYTDEKGYYANYVLQKSS